jgi:uracil-DNA glycosylase family 4
VTSSALQKLKGFLPEPSFVMAKKISSPTTTHLQHESFPVATGKVAVEATVRVAAEATVPARESVASSLLIGEARSELLFVIPQSSQRPFDGKPGQLLQKMIEAMGVRHTHVLMAVIDLSAPVKPQWNEIQDQARSAKVVIVLGEKLSQALLQSESSLAELRGKLHPFSVVHAKAKLIASFHPTELLATPALKKEAWEDLKIAIKELGLKPPPKGV